MGISAIIPNLNGEKLLPPLLDSLAELLAQGVVEEVVVADDGSEDHSRELVRKWGEGFRLVEKPPGAARGFGPNVNRGVRAARGEVLAVLNSDLRLSGDPLTPLTEWLRDEGVGAVVPAVEGGPWEVESAIHLWVRRGLPWVRPLPEPPGEPLIATHFSQLCLHGACFLIRRQVWELMGGFDEGFRPAYFEDVDLGMRLNLAGFRLVLDPRVKVSHLHSQTVERELGRTKEAVMLKNQLRLVQKHRRYLGLENPAGRGWLLLRGLREGVRLRGRQMAGYLAAALGP